MLFSQQLKGGGNPTPSAGNNPSHGAGGGAGSKNFPALPSLPLDTDLITMLDYNNPNKVNKSKAASNNNVVTFTKPIVPPLISDGGAAEISLTKSSGRSNRGEGPVPGTTPSGTTIPLNSTQALEDFAKKCTVMTDEMRAVIQKVLANPDLSTFIQTNNSGGGAGAGGNGGHLVPSYISPPMSPAMGGLGNVATLTLASNPNVTITPQLPPGHFLHSPSSSCSSSSASNTAASPLSSGGGGGGGGSIGLGLGLGSNISGVAAPQAPSSGSGGGRQKSVICSTKSNSLPMAILSLAGSGSNGSSPAGMVGRRNNNHNSNYGRQSHSSSSHHSSNNTSTPTPTVTPTDVIDLSSSRRSLAASAAYLQQHSSAVAQQQQQAAAAVAQHQRMAAAAAHHAQHVQQNGRSSSGGGNSSSNSSGATGNGSTGSNSGSGSGNSSNGGNGSTGSGSGSGSGGTSSNSASMHLQRHAALAAAAAADSAQRLCVIPEIPTNNMNLTPYKVQKVCVDKHLVPCINMKAYNDSEQLMTLIEFQKNFFPSVPLDHCKRLIEALGVELYKANR